MGRMEKDFLTIGLGSVYKVHRKRKKIVLDTISRQSNISIKRLSKFENGKIILPEPTLNLLYQCIGMKYNRCEADIDAFYVAFNDFYEKIIMYTLDKEEFQQLEKLKPLIETTEIYPQYMLAELVYHVYINDLLYNYIEKIDFLNEFFDFLDDRQKQIYFDTVGVYFKNMGDYNEAIRYFRKAFVYGDEVIRGLVNYHISCVLCKSGFLIESLECIKSATLTFAHQFNLKRGLLCSNVLGDIYTRLGMYKQGVQYYKKCIMHMPELGMKEEVIQVYNNLIWAYVLSKQYEKAIEKANKIIRSDPEDVLCYFYKAFSYYQLGNISDAKQIINRAKEIMEDLYVHPYTKAIISAYSTLLCVHRSLKIKERKLLIALKEAQKLQDYQLEIFVLSILVDLYSQENDDKKAFFYQKMITELYKNRK